MQKTREHCVQEMRLHGAGFGVICAGQHSEGEAGTSTAGFHLEEPARASGTVSCGTIMRKVWTQNLSHHDLLVCTTMKWVASQLVTRSTFWHTAKSNAKHKPPRDLAALLTQPAPLKKGEKGVLMFKSRLISRSESVHKRL